MPVIQLSDSLLHYARTGSGPHPVVMVHGGFGSTSGLWTRTAEALPSEFSAFMPDFFVGSTLPPARWHVTALADLMAEWIGRLELPPVTIMGHSMGGVVSMLVALRHPALVRQLMPVCSGPSVRNHGVAVQLLEKLQREGSNRATLTEISRHWFHAEPDPMAFGAYVDAALDAPLQAMVDVQRSLIATDLEPQLDQIGAPTLVLHGKLDHGRTLEHADALRRGIPGAGLVLFQHSGHAPMWEQPDAFDAALHGFLTAGRGAPF